MNAWTHPTNSRIALGLPVWVHLARTNPSSKNSGPFAQTRESVESQFAGRCFARPSKFAREHRTQQSVNILIRDTYIWVGFHSQCLFSLTPFFRLKKRQIHIRRIHFILPSFGRWSDTASTRLGPTETWLASNKTSAILDSQSAGMRRSFAQIYYFVLVFLMFFRKGVVRGCIIDDDTNCVSFSHSCVNKGQVFLSLLCEMPQESLFSRCWGDYVSTSVWLFPNATALH